MKLSVVIVTYNSKTFIDRCIKPLMPHIGDDLEVVVWDNESPDGTHDYVAQSYPSVRLFGRQGNLGFSRGNNAAFRECRGDFVLLLNPDAFLNEFAQIQRLLLEFERDRQVAAVGPMLANPDGSHQVGDAGWRHDLWRAIAHFLFLHKLFGIESLYLTNARFELRDRVEVDWVCGACTLVSRRTIDEVGGLKDDIFMYGEDVEWGTRIRDAGYRVVYVPSVKVLHLQGASQKDDEESVHMSTKWLNALALEICRNNSALGFATFKMVAALGFLLRWVLLLLAPPRQSRKQLVRARHMLSYCKFVIDFPYKSNRREN